MGSAITVKAMHTINRRNATDCDTSQLLTPISESFALKLTDDEKRKGCVVFHLPAEVTGLDADAVAVCEPAGPWQWLAVGALAVYNAYYEWEDKLAATGQQQKSELATRVGRVLAVDKEAKKVVFSSEDGELESESWPAADLRGMWLIGRTACCAKPSNVTQAA